MAHYTDFTKRLVILAFFGLFLWQPFLPNPTEGRCFAAEPQNESPGSSAATGQPSQDAPGTPAATNKPSRSSRKLDINVANKQSLIRGLRLTDEEAQKIVDHRPYADVEQLRTKHVVSQKSFDRIKNLVVAR